MLLITGGAGFFGSVLTKKLIDLNHEVICYDLNTSHLNHKNLQSIQGDILDQSKLDDFLGDVDIVFHNVAQVPIAKDKKKFWTVNYHGMKAILDACIKNNVKRLIYTSSSAVFGIPKSNPVTSETIPNPMESYGEAKLAAESLCLEYINKGLEISIIRPRTIIGSGRLGIFQILFEWIYQNRNIPVLGTGANLYQFIHADDLANACIAAGFSEKTGIYNIGTDNYQSMRETLEHLVKYANSDSKVVSVPKNLTSTAMNITSKLGLSPLGPYHSLMYGESMYFDISKAKQDLNFNPRFSNKEMFEEVYGWYVDNRLEILSGSISGSKHQTML